MREKPRRPLRTGRGRPAAEAKKSDEKWIHGPLGSILTYMKPHEPTVRTALRALRLFLSECAMDRTRHNLPLGDLVDCEDVGTFHLSVEEMLRALLVDYSLEQRSMVIKESLKRSVRDEFFH